MARPFLLIDGYNLMHAAGLARRDYGPGELEKCRHRFVRYVVRHLTPGERPRTTIVFDAADAPPGVARHHVIQELEVLFAPRGEDADSLIEELIARHSAPRLVRLVSSDRRLQKAARRRKADFVRSETFIAELERRGPVTDRPARPAPSDPDLQAKFTGRVPAGTTEQWLEVFGEIPEAEQLESRADELEFWQDRINEVLEEERLENGDPPA